MKSKIIFLLFVLALSACALKVDPTKGQALAESLLTDLKNEHYENLNTYYSASFNESQPLEEKIEKFKKIKAATGDIQSWELTSSSEKYDSDKGINELQLKYKVKCSRLTVEQTFIIINDEGNEKIIFQNIENL